MKEKSSCESESLLQGEKGGVMEIALWDKLQSIFAKRRLPI